MAGSLQVSQTHDGNEIADVEAPRRRVEPAVRNDWPRGEHCLHAFGVLIEEPAPCELVEK
jgi:hypothetical protein